jgi:hypothetical protein
MKKSHQNSVLFCESDLYALMQPDARKLLALSDEVDFPALRGQFRGENLPEIYRRLSEIAGADDSGLCQDRIAVIQKYTILIVDWFGKAHSRLQMIGSDEFHIKIPFPSDTA